MKILITGGTVFVSRYYAEYFASRGKEVYVLNRNSKPQVYGVKLIECDRHKIDGRLKGMHFDTVIDATAYTAEDINGLLDALEGFDNFVMISSGAVYPETLESPFGETDKRGANKFWGDYGTNKIAAEDALVKRFPGAYILRPPYLYGEYNNIYREAFVFDCAEKNSEFYLPQDGSMPLQFFHVDDLCKFTEAILRFKPDKKVFNVGNALVTVKEWVSACYRAVGKTPSFVNVSGKIEQRNYFPFHNYAYVLDTAAQNKIMSELLQLEIGLQRAYDWYKNNKDTVRRKNYFEFIESYLK